MSEEYKQELLVALQAVQRSQESGRAELARQQLESLIKHLERYECQPQSR